MFNITDFRSSINTRGVLKSNKYLVEFGIPTYLRNRYGTDDQSLMSLRCESVSIPGFDFLSADGPPRMGYGAIEKHPYVPGFTGLNLTFLLDSKSKIYNFFFDWAMSIVNFNGRGGTNFSRDDGWSAYEVGYKVFYKTDLKIMIYDGVKSEKSNSVAGNEILKLNIFDAFPMGMPSVPLAWDSPDLIRLSIPFTFTDFSIDRNNPPKAPEPTAPLTQATATPAAPVPPAPAPQLKWGGGGGSFGGGGATGSY